PDSMRFIKAKEPFAAKPHSNKANQNDRRGSRKPAVFELSRLRQFSPAHFVRDRGRERATSLAACDKRRDRHVSRSLNYIRHKSISLARDRLDVLIFAWGFAECAAELRHLDRKICLLDKAVRPDVLEQRFFRHQPPAILGQHHKQVKCLWRYGYRLALTQQEMLGRIENKWTKLKMFFPRACHQGLSDHGF